MSEYESLAKPICESALNGRGYPIRTDERLITVAEVQAQCNRPLYQPSIKSFFQMSKNNQQINYTLIEDLHKWSGKWDLNPRPTVNFVIIEFFISISYGFP